MSQQSHGAYGSNKPSSQSVLKLMILHLVVQIFMSIKKLNSIPLADGSMSKVFHDLFASPQFCESTWFLAFTSKN